MERIRPFLVALIISVFTFFVTAKHQSFVYMAEVRAQATEICDDEIDNDLDNFIDCLDADCIGEAPCVESLCNDDLDNDEDTYTDCEDPDCSEAATCLEQNNCTDQEDNDLDGLIDCNDTDCAEDPAC